MTNSETILKIKQTASRNLPKGASAVLYGSRARGDDSEKSDWDILILLNKDNLEQSDYDTISFPFIMLGCEIGEEINPIMYTQKEWENSRTTLFYANVLHDGIKLT